MQRSCMNYSNGRKSFYKVSLSLVFLLWVLLFLSTLWITHGDGDRDAPLIDSVRIADPDDGRKDEKAVPFDAPSLLDSASVHIRKMQKPLPELLKEFGLPVGIFPQDATNYEFNEETGKLVVFIPETCEVGYRDSSVLLFSTTVTAVFNLGLYNSQRKSCCSLLLLSLGCLLLIEENVLISAYQHISF